MAALKNPKHEKFVQELISGETQYAAYLAAYPASKVWKRATVDSKASNLFKDGKIQARYQELQNAAASNACLTRARKLRILRDIAEDQNADLRDRMKAIDIDNKMQGEYVQHVDAQVDVKNSPKFDEIIEQIAKSGGIGLSDDD